MSIVRNLPPLEVFTHRFAIAGLFTLTTPSTPYATPRPLLLVALQYSDTASSHHVQYTLIPRFIYVRRAGKRFWLSFGRSGVSLAFFR